MENIIEKFTPEIIQMYGISVHEDRMLCISLPNFIGINIETITEIEDSEVCFKIRTDAVSIALWKSTIMTHTTIF